MVFISLVAKSGGGTEGVSDLKEGVVYFEHCGEVNTTRTLEIARQRAEALGIGDIIIASETGRSALVALKVFTGDALPG